MRNFALFCLLLSLAGFACAQDFDCLRDAKDQKTLTACASELTSPLEEKVMAQMTRLREKYQTSRDQTGRDLDFLLLKSKQSWDEYRNNHCIVEGVLDRRGAVATPELEQSRLFIRCVIRTLQQRISELDAL